MKIRIVMIVLICTCAATLARSQGAASAVDEAPELSPGLDTRYIDTSADPCVNFFQYACGNFPKYHPIPSDRSGYGTGTMVFEHNEYVLHAMLEKEAFGCKVGQPMMPQNACRVW